MQAVSQKLRPEEKSISANLAAKFRELTWKYRAFPHFIIAGAQKCGTSSLFYYLTQHPHLIPSCVKEVHYFDGGYRNRERDGHRSFPRYQSYFSLKIMLTKHHRVFEASPSYIFHPLAPHRIHNMLPDVKFIILLRNPIDRAISHYLHEKRSGHEPLVIMDALLNEEGRLKQIEETGDFDNILYRRYSYKSRGKYKEQLERYFKVFPRNHILVLQSEDFFSDLRKHLRMIFEFVGVDPTYQIHDLKPRNVAPNRVDVGQEVYEYLTRFFKPHNEELSEFLGQDFGWSSGDNRNDFD